MEPIDSAGLVQCQNNYGDTIPPWGLLEATGVVDGLVQVTRPTADNLEHFLVNGPLAIPDGAVFTVTNEWPTPVIYGPGTPGPGTLMGTTEDSFEALVGGTGMVVYGKETLDGEDVAYVRPFSGAGWRSANHDSISYDNTFPDIDLVVSPWFTPWIDLNFTPGDLIFTEQYLDVIFANQGSHTRQLQWANAASATDSGTANSQLQLGDENENVVFETDFLNGNTIGFSGAAPAAIQGGKRHMFTRAAGAPAPPNNIQKVRVKLTTIVTGNVDLRVIFNWPSPDFWIPGPNG